MIKNIEPPSHLSDTMKNWWRRVNEDFAMEAHHLHLLQLACEAFDQAETARVALMIQGTAFHDRWQQPRQRPEVAIQQQARRDFSRFERELGLQNTRSAEHTSELQSLMRISNAVFCLKKKKKKTLQ